ncbi:MAG: amino acid ABC transporter ATP-binding protein [Eubacterium sp.]
MIKIEGLSKSFGDLQVLKHIDLEINDGETFAVIGPSGSGKTTMLRCLNLLEEPDAGKVMIGSHSFEAGRIDKKKRLEIRRATAMVFQNYNLFENKSVIQNITMPLTVVKKISAAEAEEEARQLLKKVGLEDKADARPYELSGGQQQRIGIARAIALKPEVILFDEPTSALDPGLVEGVLEVIRDIVKGSVTAVIVTHEMRFARDVADRAAFFSDGVIEEVGPAKELIEHPQKEKTQHFLSRYLNQ